MKKWFQYEGHERKTYGKREKIDNNIYTFDIETTSFILYENNIYPAVFYDKLDEKEKKKCTYYATMYIWQFGINDTVYYGRTWEELEKFLKVLDSFIPEKKYVFVHNLAFEFQFLKGEFSFSSVFARKSRKVMYAMMRDFNITFKCSYFMSDSSLANLPRFYHLPVSKLVGELDYDTLRNSLTPLSEMEKKYCEYDCLVVYYYIIEELKTYEYVSKIPTTSTGHVRRELMELTQKDFKYKRIVRKSINTDPIIYNRMQLAFMGGITHASWLYSDKILTNIDSYDETSAYPYVLTTYKYASQKFREVKIESVYDMSKKFAYIIEVEFKGVNSRYYNTYISSSKCIDLVNCKYDNGRVISADSFSMVITDIDFYLILDCYDIESYTIKRAWTSPKAYLHIKFIKFVLDKYVKKTTYKDNPELELEYMKEKRMFNALFGMSVTQNIRNNVIYNDEDKTWEEIELTNEEIIEGLEKEEKKAFLSFSTGLFVTAYARDNLFRRVMALDDYVVYMDTDSLKLVPGYDINIIKDYNKTVENRINKVSKALRIPVESFAPQDIHGKSHMLGLFEFEEVKKGNPHTYDKFCTQGAKKYCYEVDGEIHITVAGVPKKNGAKCLSKIEDFKDNLLFPYDVTHIQSAVYIDNQTPIELTDYLGNKEIIKDKGGCCILPCSYTLNKSNDYRMLLSDMHSERAIYKENE